MKKLLFATFLFAGIFARAQGPGACTDIFISEYLEGSSLNKAIELYNPTANTLDLSNYTLKIYFNGATTSTDFVPLGMLAPGQTFNIVNYGASAYLLSLADTTQAVASVMSFNGDDALRLYHGATLIDVIGVVGVDPGTNWPVFTGGTSEYTLVRSPTHYHGDTVWTGSADTTYIVYPQDDSTHFGFHTCIPTLDPMITTADSVLCNLSFGMFLNAMDTTGVWSGTYVTNSGAGVGFFSSSAIAPAHYVATYGGNSCLVPASVNVYVPVPPMASFTSTVVASNAFQFSSTSTNANSYLWTFDTAGTSTAPVITFTFSVNGPYYVCLEVTSDSGCSALYCQTIVANGLNETQHQPVYKIYPNPAADYFTVNNVAPGLLVLRNCFGQVVLTKQLSDTNANIPVAHLPAGVYNLSLGENTGRLVIAR
jgi:hypothetical protein